jgi:hypothetical protein
MFAQGSAAVTGSKRARADLVLHPSKIIAELKAVANSRAPHCNLLRIYWYDGAIGGIRPTTDQAAVASLDDVKLRLGFVNSAGQQKGVDSLIVTDLIELARLKSITDAILLSGDEDVRVGVQIAQNYGVRVHLLGIAPSRGSQSLQLIQEADTSSEWEATTISQFLEVRKIDMSSHESPKISEEASDHESLDPIEIIRKSTDIFVKELVVSDIESVSAFWKTGARGVPSELDGKLLSICGKTIGRKLDRPEINYMRSQFQDGVRTRLTDQESSAASGIGSDASISAEPSPRSGGCVRG